MSCLNILHIKIAMNKDENFLYQVAKADAELFHSNMLAFLWGKYPELANKIIAEGFLSESDIVSSDNIMREKLRIDILLIAGEKIVAIENKFKSRHTEKQLKGYWGALIASYKEKEIRLIALTPTDLDAKRTAGRLRLDENHFHYISFESHILNFLTAALDQARKEGDQSAVFYLFDYINIVAYLVAQCKKFEEPTATFGDALEKISGDAELKGLRLTPLMQLQIFERIHGVLHKLLSEDVEIKIEDFVLDQVTIASKSIQGNITLALEESIKKNIGGVAFSLSLGLQLEGAKLRRFVIFRKVNGTEIDGSEKKLIHEMATELQKQKGLFCRDIEVVERISRPQHFPESDVLYPLLAFRNSPSVYFVYRNVNDSSIGNLTLEGVAERLVEEFRQMTNIRKFLTSV